MTESFRECEVIPLSFCIPEATAVDCSLPYLWLGKGFTFHFDIKRANHWLSSNNLPSLYPFLLLHRFIPTILLFSCVGRLKLSFFTAYFMLKIKHLRLRDILSLQFEDAQDKNVIFRKWHQILSNLTCYISLSLFLKVVVSFSWHYQRAVTWATISTFGEWTWGRIRGDG